MYTFTDKNLTLTLLGIFRFKCFESELDDDVCSCNCSSLIHLCSIASILDSNFPFVAFTSSRISFKSFY